MRSHSLLRKSHLLVKRSGLCHHPASSLRASSSCTLKSSRNTWALGSNRVASGSRFISTGAPAHVESEEPWTAPLDSTSPEAAEPFETPSSTEEPDKDKATPRPRRTRVNGSAKEIEPVEFPPGLENDILYVPTQSLLDSRPGGLPPPEIFEEALDHLLITLHPNNQNGSVSSSGGPSSRPIEPTLGLYCPIEGGDYVLDLTVHELAYQTGAEVLILDAVQLAAGGWGPFGKAANAFNLPENPLHFSQPPPPSAESNREQNDHETMEEGEGPFMFSASPKMSLSFQKGFGTLPFGRLSNVSSRKASPTKLDTFFEALVNMPLPQQGSSDTPPPSIEGKVRPRLIYIRDFPTLANSSSMWYPSLLAAVKQRRRSRNSNSSPVTIIFGMTPSVTPPTSDSTAGPSNLMNMLMNRSTQSSQIGSSRKYEQASDYGEGETADIAREKRLRSRLRKWEKSTAGLHDEFPSLSLQSEESENSSPGPRIIMLGSPEASSPTPLGLGIMESMDGGGSQFFRSIVLVPRTRSLSEEKESRMNRRREINELTMRMGIGAIGGVLDPKPASETLSNVIEDIADSLVVASPTSTVKPLWEDWGQKVEVWSNVRKIADRAMGSVMARQRALTVGQANLSLDSITVPWEAIQAAWISYHSMISARQNWLKEAIGHPNGDDAVGGGKDGKAAIIPDKIVEDVKNDPDLDQHESRLLSCIVDSVSINTTFNQVHLPPHTIDAVRTIVSLPLLHPKAFQHGILKEHSMTGCLLFGPPGTGKTLVVRALAKEAGCRMLAISPSDVMDMYVGEGEKLVRAVFSLARRLSPCVVFLDEIDALFGARMSARESGSAFAHRGVITEFMQEMDGLKSSKEDNVIVIGATNRPFDLDDAVLRRLPRRLLVDLPGEKERLGILKILLRDETMTDDVDIESLAKKTDGFSGSDLKHLCVSAALDSVKEHTKLPWASRHSINDPAASSEIMPVCDTTVGITATEVIVQNNIEDVPLDIGLSNETAVEELELPKTEQALAPPRTLRLNNFTQALKEITPSSSETLGSLADLRKWNDEFGEGRRDRKKRQVWGKGRFGFVNNHKDKPEGPRIANERTAP